MNYILLVIGFVLLIKGADFFVDGAVSVANKLKIPAIIVGLTIVAIGTSLPEITISTLASIQGNNGVALSNITGSDLLNIGIVLAVTTIICPVMVNEDVLKRDYIALFLSEALLLFLALVPTGLSRTDGALLLLIFIGYTAILIKTSKGANTGEDEEQKEFKLWKVLLFLVGGCVAIKFGGDFVVDAATEIAKGFGMSDNLIGLTIIAFGTSLPELVTSIVAAKKGETDLALGNVIGSDLFNIILALALAATISPIQVLQENVIDIVAVIIITLLSFLFARTNTKIERWEGFVLLIAYLAYFIWRLF